MKKPLRCISVGGPSPQSNSSADMNSTASVGSASALHRKLRDGSWCSFSGTPRIVITSKHGVAAEVPHRCKDTKHEVPAARGRERLTAHCSYRMRSRRLALGQMTFPPMRASKR